MREQDVYIAFGSNRGSTRSNVTRALHRLAVSRGVRVVKRSRLYRTAPVGGPRQADFVNAVAHCRVTLAPGQLMKRLLTIERSLGRVRGKGPRWGPRVIDLDLLAYGRRILNTAGLVLPHPRLHERRFVLKPLADVAPLWRHPVLKQRTLTLLRQLTPRDQRVTILGRWTATLLSQSRTKRKKNPRSSR